jgi:hypothetical protein
VSYDGDIYIGVDEEAYDEANSQASDTWLRQRIRGNLAYLQRGIDDATQVYYHPLSDYEGSLDRDIRPWASLDWSYPIVVPILLDAGLESVTLTVFGAAFLGLDEGEAPLAVTALDMRLDILDAARRPVASSTTAGIAANLALPRPISRTATIQGGWKKSRQYGWLRFGIRSRVGIEASEPENDLTGIAGVLQLTDTGGGSAWGPRDYAVQQITFWNSVDGDRFQIRHDIHGVVPADPSLWIWPAQPFSSVPASTYRRRSLGYLVALSGTIQTRHSTDYPSGVALGDLRARQLETASANLRLAQQPTSYHDRPRLIAHGPRGRITPRSEEWPASYHERWPWADGDGTTQDLFRDCVFLSSDQPRIETVLYVIVTYYDLANTSAGQGGSVPGWVQDRLSDSPFCDWEIAVDVRESGAGTPLGEDSVELTLPAYPTAAVASRYLLHKAFLHDAGRVNDPDSVRFATREGQLYEEDLALIVPIPIAVTLDGAIDPEHPLVISVTAQRTSPLQNATDLADFEDRLHLTCVGYSIYQWGRSG